MIFIPFDLGGSVKSKMVQIKKKNPSETDKERCVAHTAWFTVGIQQQRVLGKKKAAKLIT